MVAFQNQSLFLSFFLAEFDEIRKSAVVFINGEERGCEKHLHCFVQGPNTFTRREERRKKKMKKMN